MTFWKYIPVVLILAGAASAAVWFGGPRPETLLRTPGMDRDGNADPTTSAPALAGTLTTGEGKALESAATWEQFRGNVHDGVASDSAMLPDKFDAGRTLWTVNLGEGYCGPTIDHGRVFLIDYDADQRTDAVRCLSLEDGKEIWRLSYPVDVKRNHGMTRTVPACDESVVVTIGPKCHLVVCDTATGKLLWSKDMAREYGTKVPPWYAGQCPILDTKPESDVRWVVVAPAGRKVLMTALDAKTGSMLWETPNTPNWSMTHSSVMPMTVAGKRQYIYCGNGGVAGVEATTGKLLWNTDAWKVGIATVPSPVDLGEGRLFLSGGYGSGAMILQVIPPAAEGAEWTTKVVRKMAPEEFGAEQHTPILRDGYLYGVRADGQMVCLDRNGDLKWGSGSNRFGLGAYLIAGDRILAINDTGMLSMIEARPEKFVLVGKGKVIPEARECWGPLAIADGRLLVRDLTRLVCLDMRPASATTNTHGAHHEHE